MFLPAESLKKPQVGTAEFAPSAQVTPVWPPVVMSACMGRELRMCFLCSSPGAAASLKLQAAGMVRRHACSMYVQNGRAVLQLQCRMHSLNAHSAAAA